MGMAGPGSLLVSHLGRPWGIYVALSVELHVLVPLSDGLQQPGSVLCNIFVHCCVRFHTDVCRCWTMPSLTQLLSDTSRSTVISVFAHACLTSSFT